MRDVGVVAFAGVLEPSKEEAGGGVVAGLKIVLRV